MGVRVGYGRRTSRVNAAERRYLKKICNARLCARAKNTVVQYVNDVVCKGTKIKNGMLG